MSEKKELVEFIYWDLEESLSLIRQLMSVVYGGFSDIPDVECAVLEEVKTNLLSAKDSLKELEELIDDKR